MAHIVQENIILASARLPTLSLKLLHLVRILLLNALDGLIPVVFHHALLLEVFHLQKLAQSNKVT